MVAMPPTRACRAEVFIMSLFDVLAWGFVGFTALLCGGVGWLWWQERHTERP